MKLRGVIATALAAGLSLLLLSSATAAVLTTVDFEGLGEGSTVSTLSSGNGISGPAVSGFIGVHAEKAGSPASNDAMIFDATCLPGGTAPDCTGDPDSDLFAPALGNVLIITQNNDASNPSDASQGGVIEFDFSTFDGGQVFVESLTFTDIEPVAAGLSSVEVWDGVVMLDEVFLVPGADGNIQIVDVNVGGVDFMRINFPGQSGSVDNIRLQTDEEEVIDGWMTGGGNITEGRGRSAVTFSTHGFIIRCDASFAQFQYNDHVNGGNFHLQSASSVVCSDAGGINPHPPAADFDTLTMIGTGTWNGVPGATVVVTMTDTGQPANADVLDILVEDVGGNVVSDRVGTLTVGNHQAH